MPGRRDIDEVTDVVDEMALDAAIVDVQRAYPYDSWRGVELRDILGLALHRRARRPGRPPVPHQRVGDGG